MAGYRFQSLPVELHWAGWRSDTYSLQKAGWELSAEQDPHYERMRIAFRHQRLNLRGISETFTRWNYRDMFEGGMIDRRNLPVLHVEHLAPNIVGQVVRTFRVENFRPIDAMPQIAHDEIRTLDDLVHFAPAQAQQQLILPEPSVPELLEKIVAMQADARLQHFRDVVAEERSQPLVHAQIISFPRAA